MNTTLISIDKPAEVAYLLESTRIDIIHDPRYSDHILAVEGKGVTLRQIAALIRCQCAEIGQLKVEKGDLQDELSTATEINDLRRQVHELQKIATETLQERVADLEKFVSNLAYQHDFDLGNGHSNTQEFINGTLAEARELVGDKREW